MPEGFPAMRRVDIRPLKQQYRQEVKEWRSSISPDRKRELDERILSRLLGLREYTSCNTILTYVSKPIEVDTAGLIMRAWEDGKQVAVPRCVSGSRSMEFYYVTSFDDLAPQTFGVLEPIPGCRRLDRYQGSVCLVPALAYDRSGYRLGYGSGYYDRFLSGYDGLKIGVVYSENLNRRLWHGRYDIPVDLIVTEKRLYTCPKHLVF